MGRVGLASEHLASGPLRSDQRDLVFDGAGVGIDEQRRGCHRIVLGAAYENAVFGFDSADLGTAIGLQVLPCLGAFDGASSPNWTSVSINKSSNEDNTLAFSARDFCPVVWVGRVWKVFVFGEF